MARLARRSTPRTAPPDGPARTACFRLPDHAARAHRWAGREGALVVVARGRVVAATRGPAARGVAAGMTAARAAALAPRAALVERDRALEAAAWEAALEGLVGLSPWVESPEAGLAYVRGHDAAAAAAHARRHGFAAGEAAGRTLARIAAVRAAAGHLLAVPAGDEPTFLRRTPVAALPALGFPADVDGLLRLLGYDTLGALARLTRRQLEAQFGPTGGGLYALVHPPRERPVALYRPPRTAAGAVELEGAPCEPAHVLPALDVALERAVAGLGAALARRLTLEVETEGGPRRGGRVLPEATADARRLRATARALLLDALEALPPERAGVERVTVVLGGLGPAPVVQTGLFERRPGVALAVRAVHRRFPGAIVRARVVRDALFDEDRQYFEPFPEAA